MITSTIQGVYLRGHKYIKRWDTARGIKINGHRIDMLRFTDDIAIIAESEENLKTILETKEETIICQ